MASTTFKCLRTRKMLWPFQSLTTCESHLFSLGACNNNKKFNAIVAIFTFRWTTHATFVHTIIWTARIQFCFYSSVSSAAWIKSSWSSMFSSISSLMDTWKGTWTLKLKSESYLDSMNRVICMQNKSILLYRSMFSFPNSCIYINYFFNS